MSTFILLSIFIGSGIFNINDEVLRLAGPMGLLLAVLLFGVVATLVPVPNAIFEFVDTFVDHGVAWAVGAMYWLAYSSILPIQVIGAGKLLRFRGVNDEWIQLASAGWPFLILTINLVHIKGSSKWSQRPSMTLYGLTYKLGGSGIKAYINERTGVVLPKTGAPAMAILVSLMAWYRLVFLDIPRDNGATRCSRELKDEQLDKFLPSSETYDTTTPLAWLHPTAARLDPLGCFVIVCICATVWKTGVNGTKFMEVSGAHILFTAVIIIRKTHNYFRRPGARGWVCLDSSESLTGKLSSLDDLSGRAANRVRSRRKAYQCTMRTMPTATLTTTMKWGNRGGMFMGLMMGGTAVGGKQPGLKLKSILASSAPSPMRSLDGGARYRSLGRN
ncbi:hypothetical protein MCOR25_004093 [Pyricularia grisea]|nr:hypothetical protein MCOR25_004093 [Pyricularia grisea]